MEDLDLETCVPDWLIEYPELLALFQQLAIDYCCGGKSLRTACIERDLSPQDVSSRIQQILKPGKPEK